MRPGSYCIIGALEMFSDECDDDADDEVNVYCLVLLTCYA